MNSINRAAAIVASRVVCQSRSIFTVKITQHQNLMTTATRFAVAAVTGQKFKLSYTPTTSNGGISNIRHSSDIATSNRPFTILGVQQIAIGHDDRSALNHLWYSIFGLQPSVQNVKMENENVCEDIVRVGGINEATAIEIDLMTPIDVNKSPKVHVPPLNHIGLWVDDLPNAVEWMTQQGVRFTPGGIRKGAAGYDVTFIHPKGNDAAPIGGNGILIELVQAPDHIKDMLMEQQPK